MAGVIVLGVAMACIKAKDAVQDRRSPLLPISSSSLTLSERDIKKLLSAWATRLYVLNAKVRGLDAAHERGLEFCWAGRVSHRQEVRKAREEARWVTVKLEKALEWCKAQGVRKGSFVVVGKKAQENRPMHAHLPPTLFELPLPVPLPPRNDIYTLTVPRVETEAPPMYNEETIDGEKLLDSTEQPPLAYEA